MKGHREFIEQIPTGYPPTGMTVGSELCLRVRSESSSPKGEFQPVSSAGFILWGETRSTCHARLSLCSVTSSGDPDRQGHNFPFRQSLPVEMQSS